MMLKKKKTKKKKKKKKKKKTRGAAGRTGHKSMTKAEWSSHNEEKVRGLVGQHMRMEKPEGME